MTFTHIYDAPPVSIPAPVYRFNVTLRNHATEDEYRLYLDLLTDSFAVVFREICHQRAIKELFGYEIAEVIDLNDPFLPDEF